MSEQLFQIGIKGLVRNAKGEILMVHIPAWSNNPGHWDFPGGRMDPGETFIQTLKRELHEEIGVKYDGVPRQLQAVLTNITIPVGDVRIPLVLIVFDVELPKGCVITLDSQSAEDEYGWFTPTEAAKHLSVKFPDEFCEMIRTL